MKKIVGITCVALLVGVIALWFFGQNSLKNYIRDRLNQTPGIQCQFRDIKLSPLSQKISVYDLQIQNQSPAAMRLKVDLLQAKLSVRQLLHSSVYIKSLFLKGGDIYVDDIRALAASVNPEPAKAQDPRTATSDLVAEPLNDSARPQVTIESVRVEKVNLFLDRKKAISIDQMALKNILRPGHKSRLSLNAYLGDDVENSLFIDTQFVYESGSFRIVDMKQILNDFPLQTAFQLLGLPWSVTGTLDMTTSFDDNKAVVSQIKLNRLGTQGNAPQAIRDVVAANPDLQGDIVVSDFDSNPLMNFSLREFHYLGDLNMSGIHIAAFLNQLQGPYRLSQVLIDDLAYVYNKKPQLSSRSYDASPRMRPYMNEDASVQHSELLPLQIDMLKIANGRVSYYDRTEAQAKQVELEHIQLEVKNLDFATRALAPFQVLAKFPEQGTLNAVGFVSPSADPYNVTFRADIRDVNMLSYEPFFPKLLKGALKEGYATLHSRGEIRSNIVDSEHQLIVSDLRFEEGAQMFGKNISEIADYLSDQDGRLVIPMTVKGHIKDPKFGVTSLLRDAVFGSILSDFDRTKDFFKDLGEKGVDSGKDALKNVTQLLPALLGQGQQTQSLEDTKESLKSVGKGLEEQFKSLLRG